MKTWNEIRTLKLTKEKNCNEIEDILTFDIETSNVFIKNNRVEGFNKNNKNEYYEKTQKQGFMYIWMFGINETVYYGRTWDEFKEFIEILNDKIGDKIATIYVHNLSFEFQFLRNVFEFEDVFARKQREVIKCRIKNTNIWLKCSYALSNLSLSNIGKRYEFTDKKMDGDLDYDLLRNSKTKLSEKELGYCENDCRTLYHYIKMKKEEYGKFRKIPLTVTGEVRKELKEYISENYHNRNKFSYKDWKDYIANYTPTYKTFIDMIKSFQGGYCHANKYFVGKIVENVHNYDFTSSYPFVMLSEKFPCERFWSCSDKINELDYENKCYIMKLNLKGVHCKSFTPSISAHKMSNFALYGLITDNGRVVECDECEITITEQDYKILIDNYDIDEIEVLMIKSAKKDYLPRTFIEFIIKTYERKSKLKKEIKKEKDKNKLALLKIEYESAKEKLNSLYGMCITNYIRDDIDFDEEWKESEIDEKQISDKLLEARKEKLALLPYCWGVWISAYARKNIFDILKIVGEDYIYTDTDSVKCINDYSEQFEEYNKNCKNKIQKMCSKLKIKKSVFLNGIGELDVEDNYREIKTMGAKRYSYRDLSNELHCVVSGISKNAYKALNNDLKNFKSGLIFDYELSGKKLKFYNDDQKKIIVKDYQGNTEEINDKFGICIQSTIYKIEDDVEISIEKKYNYSKFLEKF